MGLTFCDTCHRLTLFTQCTHCWESVSNKKPLNSWAGLRLVVTNLTRTGHCRSCTASAVSTSSTKRFSTISKATRARFLFALAITPTINYSLISTESWWTEFISSTSGVPRYLTVGPAWIKASYRRSNYCRRYVVLCTSLSRLCLQELAYTRRGNLGGTCCTTTLHLFEDVRNSPNYKSLHELTRTL